MRAQFVGEQVIIYVWSGEIFTFFSETIPITHKERSINGFRLEKKDSVRQHRIWKKFMQ